MSQKKIPSILLFNIPYDHRTAGGKIPETRLDGRNEFERATNRPHPDAHIHKLRSKSSGGPMNYLVPANEHERAAPPAEPCHADAVNARNAYFSSFSPPFFPFLLLPRSRLRRRPLEEGRLFFSSFSPPASFRLSAGPRSRKAIVKDAFSIRPLVWPPRKTYHVR